jgi:hypothetical protein
MPPIPKQEGGFDAATVQAQDYLIGRSEELAKRIELVFSRFRSLRLAPKPAATPRIGRGPGTGVALAQVTDESP